MTIRKPFVAAALAAAVLLAGIGPALAGVFGGKIVAVTTVAVSTGSKAGQTGAAIAGGLAGALVGNQLGKGSGNALMTGAGAVGGALLGSQLAKPKVRYSKQWTVQLDNGQRIAIVQGGGNLFVGQRVRVVEDSSGTRIEP